MSNEERINDLNAKWEMALQEKKHYKELSESLLDSCNSTTDLYQKSVADFELKSTALNKTITDLQTENLQLKLIKPCTCPIKNNY